MGARDEGPEGQLALSTLCRESGLGQKRAGD